MVRDKEKARVYRRKYIEKNRDKIRERYKIYYATNPDRMREYGLKRKYGLSVEFVDRVTQEQNGKCALCYKSTEDLLVDHDHQSGEFRAMLCRNCNTGLGQFGDSVDLLERAIIYLQKHRKIRSGS